jgi:hypothetical protein
MFKRFLLYTHKALSGNEIDAIKSRKWADCQQNSQIQEQFPGTSQEKMNFFKKQEHCVALRPKSLGETPTGIVVDFILSQSGEWHASELMMYHYFWKMIVVPELADGIGELILETNENPSIFHHK